MDDVEQGVDLKEPDHYDGLTVRAGYYKAHTDEEDHYEVPTGKDYHYETLAKRISQAKSDAESKEVEEVVNDEEQQDGLEEPGNYDVSTVRADHYEAPTDTKPEFAEEGKTCEETMKAEILTPAKNFRLQSEEMGTIKDSLVVEKSLRILVTSLSILEASRLGTLEASAEFSNPTSLLTKFSGISVRVTSFIFEFLIRIGCVKKSEIKFRKSSVIFEDVPLATQHWDMSVGREVSKFMKEFIKKSAVKERKILFANGRVKHRQIGKIVTAEGSDSVVQLNVIILMLDRFSLTDHSMTRQVGIQTSYETCYRLKDKALH